MMNDENNTMSTFYYNKEKDRLSGESLYNLIFTLLDECYNENPLKILRTRLLSDLRNATDEVLLNAVNVALHTRTLTSKDDVINEILLKQFPD